LKYYTKVTHPQVVKHERFTRINIFKSYFRNIPSAKDASKAINFELMQQQKVAKSQVNF
jgi:hypothetical protein